MILEELKVRELIDPVIKELLSLDVDKKFQDIVEYQISAGGKRLRPALAIVSYRLLGGQTKDILYPAAGLEILHNYSLIVDDIIDESTLRRNKPTTWSKLGKSIAQCVGMDYAAAIFQAANLSKRPVEISRLFAKTLKDLVDGEILDILFEQRGREDENYVVENRYLQISNEDYLKMVSKKTSALFQACCETGGIIAGAKEDEIKALRQYGLNFGIAFQIRDDILDIFGKEEKFGKEIGKDISERKLGNIVILYALKEFSASDKRRFLEIMRKDNIGHRDVEEGIELIRKTKSYQKASELGEKFANEAKEGLKFLPQNKWNRALAELAEFVIKREK